MSIKAGELRHRVIIQRYNSSAKDKDGFELPSQWVEHAALYAKITPLSSNDLISAQSEQSEVTARMKVRYRTDIDTTMRVIWKGRVFAISSQGLDDNNDGYTYTTFNLSGGVERFDGRISPKSELNATLETLVNEDLPNALNPKD